MKCSCPLRKNEKDETYYNKIVTEDDYNNWFQEEAPSNFRYLENTLYFKLKNISCFIDNFPCKCYLDEELKVAILEQIKFDELKNINLEDENNINNFRLGDFSYSSKDKSNNLKIKKINNPWCNPLFSVFKKRGYFYKGVDYY